MRLDCEEVVDVAVDVVVVVVVVVAKKKKT